MNKLSGTKGSRAPSSQSSETTGKERASAGGEDRNRFGLGDRLLLIAAAMHILIPVLGALVAAVFVSWLAFRLLFG